MMPRPPKSDLLQGTLDLLILKTVALGSQHGWGIAQRIKQMSQDVLQVNQGSLYPALHRLEEQGWIASEWGTSETNRQAKFYRLTRAGERQLAREAASWEQVSSAVARILQAT
jgi:PadR family transcriptional regulator